MLANLVIGALQMWLNFLDCEYRMILIWQKLVEYFIFNAVFTIITVLLKMLLERKEIHIWSYFRKDKPQGRGREETEMQAETMSTHIPSVFALCFCSDSVGTLSNSQSRRLWMTTECHCFSGQLRLEFYYFLYY